MNDEPKVQKQHPKKQQNLAKIWFEFPSSEFTLFWLNFHFPSHLQKIPTAPPNMKEKFRWCLLKSIRID